MAQGVAPLLATLPLLRAGEMPDLGPIPSHLVAHATYAPAGQRQDGDGLDAGVRLPLDCHLGLAAIKRDGHTKRAPA